MSEGKRYCQLVALTPNGVNSTSWRMFASAPAAYGGPAAYGAPAACGAPTAVLVATWYPVELV